MQTFIQMAMAAAVVAALGGGPRVWCGTSGVRYFSNGGQLEHAQEMAAHESPRTTKPYDRTMERLTQDEVERSRL
jgi:hypothetical protein